MATRKRGMLHGHGRKAHVQVNPPRAGQVMSREVLAVVYRHIADPPDVIRVHGFGDANIQLRTRRGGDVLEIAGLDEFTDVRMISEVNGDIRLCHKDGLPLWADFE